MSSRHKRSSILKKRPSVDPGSSEASPSEATLTTKTAKRIVFKPKKSVKEFFASDETATVWCNSYELSTDRTPLCMDTNDETTLENASGVDGCLPVEKCQTNKENLLAFEDRRNSGNESIWELSISAYEDEKRRLKSENSINSSVLNTTERLLQEPISHNKQVLRQKQVLEAYENPSAMDISPAKLNGKLDSPKKILYHHKKQNMFVSIDVQNEKKSIQNLDESEINFFGPKGSQVDSKNTRASKILFQTSNTPNQWRNKSIHTEPHPSKIGLSSAPINADVSAGWNSHAAVIDSSSERMTLGNSQFEISEAWNSHPAAVLKLKMLQQGFQSAEFDPLLSYGGRKSIEDVDTTIAITQTVAKMLGPGSRPASLDNKITEPEPMDVSKRREIDDMDVEVDKDTHMDVVKDVSVSDVIISPNGLSRARPSFIPGSTTMEESKFECSSHEVVKEAARQDYKTEQRATILKVVPIDSLDPDLKENRVSLIHSNIRRETILKDANIIEDDPFLSVPQVEVKTPPRTTVFVPRINLSSAERGSSQDITTPMLKIEPVKINFPELVFIDNSFGLDLIGSSETSQKENRPKIHRIASNRFTFGLNTVGSSKTELKRNLDIIDGVGIAVDSPDPKSPTEPSRKTVNALADVSLDVNMVNDAGKPVKDSRKTELLSKDVSMESPLSGNLSSKRSTVFPNDNLNESHYPPVIEVPKCSQTMLFNEVLNQSHLEPRSGSLEDLRNHGQSRRSVQCIEPMDCVDSDSFNRIQANSTCRRLLIDDVDQGALVVEDDQPSPRLTAGIENMDVTAKRSPFAEGVRPEANNQRKTIGFNVDMDPSSFINQPPLEPAIQNQKSRQTIFSRESMDQTLIEGRTVTVQEFKPSQRTTIFCQADINESIASTSGYHQKSPDGQQSRFTLPNQAGMDETCRSSGTVLEGIVNQTLRLSSLVPENMDQEQDCSLDISKEQDMNETTTKRCDTIEETIKQSSTHLNNNVDHSEAKTSFLKSRHTSCGERNIDETFSPTRKLEATLLERSKAQESLQTVSEQVAIDKTQFENPIQQKCEPFVSHTIDLTTSPQHTISHTLPNKSQLALLADRTIEETIPVVELFQGALMGSRTRLTSFKQDSMEETTTNIQKACQTVNEFKLRRTVSCEQDMEQTVSALRRVSIVEVEDSAGDSDSDEEFITRFDKRESEVDKNGTIMSDISSMNSMDISVSLPSETSHNTRRSLHSYNIAENSVQCELNVEPLQTTINAELPPYQEQRDISDFSCLVPQLPDDCVLRSATVPDSSCQRYNNPPPIRQLDPVDASLTDHSFPMSKINSITDLSDISYVPLSADESNKPIITWDDLSLYLTDVPDPPISSPESVGNVMQETPKNSSNNLMRKIRSPITDRAPTDSNESGILYIYKLNQAAAKKQEESNDRRIMEGVKNFLTRKTQSLEENVIENVVESSDDEFFDTLPDSSTSIDKSDKIFCATRVDLVRGRLEYRAENNEKQSSKVSSQTDALKQKRQLSLISTSEPSMEDPFNVSLSFDYPMKKRKTKVPTPVSNTKTQQTRKNSLHSKPSQNSKCLDVEKVISEDELTSTSHDETKKGRKFKQSVLTDTSVSSAETTDQLSKESNISLDKSLSPENVDRKNRSLKLNTTYTFDHVSMTVHVDENDSCIVISDESGISPTNSKSEEPKAQPSEKRLTLADLPERINEARKCHASNNISEFMFEINQKMSKDGKRCCCFEHKCNCGNRRAMADVQRAKLKSYREMWNKNFDQIRELVSNVVHDAGPEIRICEIFNRPLKPLPLIWLDKKKPQSPESIRAPNTTGKSCSQQFDRSPQISDTPNKVYSSCDLPATPCVIELISNKLETEDYRWFMDTSEKSKMHLYLRHRVLRSIRFKLKLQESQRWYSKKEDVRIVRIDCLTNLKDMVCSPRLFVAHIEFTRALENITLPHLCKRFPTTANIIELIEHLNAIMEQTFNKVDQLYRIISNSGAILDKHGDDDQLVIHKFYEYQHRGTIQWNRVTVQFKAMDWINHKSVVFHRKMINAKRLFPTERQCGKGKTHGLIFLEYFLLNIEKLSPK